MAYNISSIAEPAQRVAERPASKAAQNPPQITAAAGGISARPSTAASFSERGAERLCFVSRSDRKYHKDLYALSPRMGEKRESILTNILS